ncbi:MAG: hypothetical protein JWQ62_504 [Lacunisphaera sp.]|nr:hypothetical protein [Lacunisphaera sp.]
MFTILGADGKEYGPVTAGKLHEWIAGGRANLQTKARRDGETEWKILADFPEFSQFGTTTGAGAVPPVAVAPLVAPASTADAVPTPVTGTAKQIADDLIARTTSLDVFGCLGQSFELWKANFLPLVGVTLLIVLIQSVASMIPLFGFISGFFLNGVFYGGLYYYYLGKARSEPREVSDAFAGFTRAFVPLMLATVISTLLIFAVMTPFFAPIFLFILKAALSGHPGTPPELSVVAVCSILLGLIPLLYLSVSWIFTFILVLDKGLGPWTAMEVSRRVVTKQWFRVFFVILLGSILTMLGLIGLIIGVIFTMPIVFGAVICAYEHLCNPPPRASGS